ncbi:MAG: class A beta-lactamase-related serine hydrolase [candidate division WOR-3 bacterium]|nr:MAG: class A beta-lactamase-related serine hydrolase [candidate division WOR-3 bacterium]
MIKRILKTIGAILPGLFSVGLLIPVLFLFIPGQTECESEASTTIEAQFNQLFEYCKNNSLFSGSVLIAHHGNVIFKKSYGMADRENEIPNTSTTNFNVGSTSKPFTALAIAILVEQKKLNFDDPVCARLPEFPYPSVTLRHLLTHTSGLPDYVHRPPFIKYHDMGEADTSQTEVYTSQDVLDWLIDSKTDLAFEPGSKMTYCNTGFVILALVIERVTGQDFVSFIKENILIPAGMSNSLVYNKKSDPPIPNRAFGYSPSLDRSSFELNDLNRMDGIVGAGGLYTSVEDLFRFDKALYSNTLVSRQTLTEMFTPCVLNDGQRKGYGLGWILAGYDSPDPLIVKHGGKWRGFTTAFQRLIEDSSVVIILTNCGLTGPTIGSIRDAATDILQGKTPRLPKFPIADRIAEVLFEAGPDSAVQLYRFLAEHENERYFFDEHQLNVLGYRLMYENRLEDARIILEANAEAYPKSSNVYDGLGDIYKAAGDTLNAVEQYRKALSIDPDLDHTIRKLKELSVF